MSCAKQLPRTKSFYVVESGTQLSIHPDSGRVPTPKLIPAVVLWFTLATLAQFISDVTSTIAELAVDALSWLFTEFAAGCAAYAEAMYPMQIAAARPEDSADPASSAGQAVAAPAIPAARRHLTVVSNSAWDASGHDLPKQVAATGGVAVRDRTTGEPETIRLAGAAAARRKNRPR